MKSVDNVNFELDLDDLEAVSGGTSKQDQIETMREVIRSMNTLKGISLLHSDTMES